MTVLIDSSVIIDYLRRRPPALAYIEGLLSPPKISVATAAE